VFFQILSFQIWTIRAQFPQSIIPT